ncbi:FAD-dependent monooxygenase [Paenibacillus bouchesdurhonensis]|uniref:FAD-dependent monooxygenase n=1 Tax=Paenibacillus bouchesdurhonensis TaxID=1870990 RepID=UPI0019024E94|nr:FAD-dependent monooxygenase [Paenibacillus bouchesdurhonensis]
MKAIIVGAGIGGLCASIALRKVGVHTVLFDRRTEVHLGGAGLGLGANAVRALQMLGAGEELFRSGKTMSSIQIMTEQGKVLSTTHTAAISHKYGPDNVNIDRAKLLDILLRAAGDEHRIHTRKECVGFEQHAKGVRVWFKDGSFAEGDLLIAADGLRSIIRRKLLPRTEPQYAGYTCWRAVVPVNPSMASFNPNIFTETWGRGGRLGLVPLANDWIYWFACLNALESDPRFAEYTAGDLARHFQHYHEPIPQVLSASREGTLLHHDIMFLPPIRRYAFGRVVLLGDAAHATTPNMGQGAGQAIEDAIILAGNLKRSQDVVAALERYSKQRVKRTSSITRMSGRVGKVAQLDQPTAVSLRNALMPLLPDAIIAWQMKYLYRIRLEGLI